MSLGRKNNYQKKHMWGSGKPMPFEKKSYGCRNEGVIRERVTYTGVVKERGEDCNSKLIVKV